MLAIDDFRYVIRIDSRGIHTSQTLEASFRNKNRVLDFIEESIVAVRKELKV